MHLFITPGSSVLLRLSSSRYKMLRRTRTNRPSDEPTTRPSDKPANSTNSTISTIDSTIDSTVLCDLICTICIELPSGIVNQVHNQLA